MTTTATPGFRALAWDDAIGPELREIDSGQAAALIGPIVDTAPPKPDQAAIREALRVLMAPGQVTELRALDVRRRYGAPCTVSGYFDASHFDDLAAAAAGIEAAKGIYIVMNPITPALLARASNRTKECGKSDSTTTDADITARRWLLIDLDPKRPAGISSSAGELEAAQQRAQTIREHLRTRAWPDPVLACSGNGWHLLYRVDLPAADGGLVKRCLQAVADRFDDDAVTVDCGVFNPARIWKLYGTVAAKGDHTPERPHRLARIVDVPVALTPVPMPLLEGLAGELAAEPAEAQRSNRRVSTDAGDATAKSRAWLDRWLGEHKPEQIQAVGPDTWQNNGVVWTLNPCPWDPQHVGNCAYVGVTPGGAIMAGCHHASCGEKNWHELRALWDPESLERHRACVAAGTFANPVAAAKAGGYVPCTDLGNAERFAYWEEGHMRFDVAAGIWRVWDGRRWAADDGGAEAMQAAMRTVRLIQTEAFNAPAGDEDTDPRKALFKHALASEARSRLEAMLALAKALQGITTPADSWDADPWLFNCRNGTLDLRTGTLRAHDPSELITKLAPVSYDQAARGNDTWQLWEKFLNTSAKGDAALVAFLRRAVGYSLTGDVSEEVLFFIHGPENTGKSTFVEAIKTALGDYACTADFGAFVKSQGASGPRNDLARLAGKRFVSSSEVQDGKSLAEDVVKAITGNEKISARFLYHEYFDFQPQFKLWLAANHAPKVDADDGAMWRRILRIPFENIVPKAERDPRVKATFRDIGKAGPVILLWSLDGLRDWQKNRLGVPAVVEQATQEYRDDCNPLRDFFADFCVFETWAHVTAGDLHQAYHAWADQNEIKDKYRCSPRTMAKKLKERGCSNGPKGTAGQRIWKGIDLSPAGFSLLQRRIVADSGGTSVKSSENPPHGGVSQSDATSRHYAPPDAQTLGLEDPQNGAENLPGYSPEAGF